MTEVTQNNLHLLLPSKVSWLADMLCAEKHISVIEAMRQIYSSDMYKQLEQESTKRWHEGPVALYQEWMKKDLIPPNSKFIITNSARKG